MSYDRHRAYQEACRIEWRGKVFRYSGDFALQIMLARDLMRPDGVFPALSDTVEGIVGTDVVTLTRQDVDELLEKCMQAAKASLAVINGAGAK